MVLCNSESAAVQLKERASCSPGKVRVVRNPLPIAAIQAEARTARAQPALPPCDRPFILSVGRFCDGKGFPELIEAFHRIANEVPHHLVLVGDGPLRDRLEQQARELKLEQRVIFAGWNENPTPFMARCQIFAFSSECEGLPNAVLEAMAAGAPVVSTNCTSWIEDFARRGACVTVPVRDRGQLAAAMRSVLGDELLRQRLCQRAAEVVEGFDTVAVAAERNGILLSALEQHGVRG
jgi:glycosyltransferase involved in cell wall biosynthesis